MQLRLLQLTMKLLGDADAEAGVGGLAELMGSVVTGVKIRLFRRERSAGSSQ